ncbi:MAG: DMT family transporter [Pseudomonadota bacterium]
MKSIEQDTSPLAAAVSQPLLYVQVAFVTLLWGINWPIMKIAVSQMSPWLFRVITVAAAGCFVLGLSRLFGERMAVPRNRLTPLIVISLLAGPSWHLLSAFGVHMAGGGRAAIVCYTMPVWATILSAIILKERLKPRHLLGLACGMAGLVVLIGHDLVKLQAAPWGTLVMLAAALVWAGQTVSVKAFDWGFGVIALAGWQLLIAAVPLTIIWAIMDGALDISSLRWDGTLSMLYVVCVALGFCFTSYIRLVRILPASVAAISVLGVPIVGVVSSAIIVGEPITIADLAALLLVLTALVLVLWPRRRRA